MEVGEGLWVRVPGDVGLGRRVCPAAAVAGGAVIVFGGCRGLNDTAEGGRKSSLSSMSSQRHDKKKLLDARVVEVEGMLNLDLAT